MDFSKATEEKPSQNGFLGRRASLALAAGALFLSSIAIPFADKLYIAFPIAFLLLFYVAFCGRRLWNLLAFFLIFGLCSLFGPTALGLVAVALYVALAAGAHLTLSCKTPIFALLVSAVTFGLAALLSGEIVARALPALFPMPAYLLLSLKVLDAQPYDPVPLSERKTSPEWSDCALRGWLNGDFYRTAFTDAERAQILPRTFDDISVTDYVSLISTSEKKTLLDARRKELCFAEATEYALSRGLRLDNNRGDDWYCWWWLRQEKNDLTNGSVRYPHGFRGWGTGNDYSCLYGVRPSIVVKSDSIN